MKKYNLSDGNILIVKQDNSPSDPRDYDNMGKMVCFHRRYTLGDKHNYKTENYGSWDEMKKAIIKKENVAVILPLYLYDHSGITMKTTPFSCPWDSGQVGFVYATKDKVKTEYMVGRMNKKLLAKVNDILIAEIATYDQYLTGDVYGFEIETPEGEHVDSCWGFYGSDPTDNGMSENFEAKVLAEI